MGNCLKRQSPSMVWAEDDRDEWEWVSPEKIVAERESLLCDKSSASFSSSPPSSSSPSSGELKIVISKKQLEQLLGKGETTAAHVVAVDQVLAGLLVDAAGNRGGSEMLRQRSWRPRLHSIPEVN
ncbi:PREDICTED: uncharacterized protein LOC109167062 [Ipomoea nil]|uniref:uncharacterized protein LOC109167062 n=1 Tax=Ipomoea nil TaxID=35883 RepID=UPI00090162FD|nr:PREDICTED: uncharacterized protein LOC109167062 [Ipomoea nil]